jgi:hypothetical protein
MSEYCPDHWVIVEIKSQQEIIRKVLAGWNGGYVTGSRWRLSSGITDLTEKEDHYEIANSSGSVYFCYKNRQGFNPIMWDQYTHFAERLPTIDASASIEKVQI